MTDRHAGIRARLREAHTREGKMECSWCHEEIKSGAYSMVGDDAYHNGGSVFDVIETDCYSQWQAKG